MPTKLETLEKFFQCVLEIIDSDAPDIAPLFYKGNPVKEIEFDKETVLDWEKTNNDDMNKMLADEAEKTDKELRKKGSSLATIGKKKKLSDEEKKAKQRAYAKAAYWRNKEKKEAVQKIVDHAKEKKQIREEYKYHCLSCGQFFFSPESTIARVGSCPVCNKDNSITTA